MNVRIKEIRLALGMTQDEFGKKLGIARNTVANYETSNRTPSNQIVISICREFNVNEDFLRDGTGDMFIKIPEEDETAAFVSDLLEDTDNELYTMIKDIMRTYNELTPSSQDALRGFIRKVYDNSNRKKED